MARATSHGDSVLKTTVGLAAGVTWLCWAIAASVFFQTQSVTGHIVGGADGGIALVFAFLWNSFRLDQAPAIAVNSWDHQRWLFVLWGVLLVTTAGFGLYLRRVERDLCQLRR